MRVRDSLMSLVVFSLLLLESSSWATQAQPVPIPEDPSTMPQLDISAVGIATLEYGRGREHPQSESGLNFSDSAFLIGGSQRLYNNGAVGSLGIGELTIDESNRGVARSLFLHQAFLDYQSESFEALVGRTDRPTAHLVDFPTLRGDDLITLTNPLDPFSNGNNIEEHRYSNTASVTFNQGLKIFENFHVQHLINSAGVGTDTGINSFGATIQYMGTPGMEAFQSFPSFGLGYEHVTSIGQTPGGLHQIYAGGVFNLNESVTDRWDVRAQDILNLGSGLTVFQNITDSFQAAANAITASVRYLHSPFGKPGHQLALTLGYKNYFNVADAKSLGLALTAVRRLGQGFDLVGQYQGQWRASTLAVAQTGGLAYEQVGEIGFVFNFDATFNQHISPRRSLLNQLHQYIRD